MCREQLPTAVSMNVDTGVTASPQIDLAAGDEGAGIRFALNDCYVAEKCEVEDSFSRSLMLKGR